MTERKAAERIADKILSYYQMLATQGPKAKEAIVRDVENIIRFETAEAELPRLKGGDAYRLEFVQDPPQPDHAAEWAVTLAESDDVVGLVRLQTALIRPLFDACGGEPEDESGYFKIVRKRDGAEPQMIEFKEGKIRVHFDDGVVDK